MINSKWVAFGLAILAAIWYTYRVWNFAMTRDSVLDEGAYLLKGYLFLTGQYTPYQLYGPWTNHTPLGFLIPGLIQVWFGPGLEAARIFAVLVAVLLLLGLWLLTFRLAGAGYAALLIWVFAWNPAPLKAYSSAVSQGLAACLLVWMLVCVVGKERCTWQIALAGVLASALFLVRINMIPVLPLLIGYVFWQHGKRQGIVVTISSLLVALFFHALYWPNILQIWAYWLPRSLTPFLDAWRLPAGYVRLWNPDVTNPDRLLSLFMAVRAHFVEMLGLIACWLLGPTKETWKKRRDDLRTALFFTSMFLALFLIHVWATLFKNYCVFCLEPYTAFFGMLGLLMIALTFPDWRKNSPFWQQMVIIVLLLAFSGGIGFGAFQEIGTPLLDIRVPGYFLTFPRNSPGLPKIEKVLTVRYGLDYLRQRWIVSIAAGLMIGMVLLAATLLIYALVRRWRRSTSVSLAYPAMLIFLIAGSLGAPAILLGGGKSPYDCEKDTPQAYRAAGEYLASVIPPGSRVYWRGALSAVPLLYVPDIQIYPPQINGDYSYYLGGDEDTLLKFGFWNESLDQQWLEEADYILIFERRSKRWLAEHTDLPKIQELPPSPPFAYCYTQAHILVFKNLH